MEYLGCSGGTARANSSLEFFTDTHTVQPCAVRRRAGYARTLSVSPLWHTGHGSDFDELLLDRPLY